MDWRAHVNLTKPDDFWQLWDANQDAFAAIAQMEGAARSGGERVRVGVPGSVVSRAAILLPLPLGRASSTTVAALTLLAWDVLTTLDDEVGGPSSKSDERI